MQFPELKVTYLDNACTSLRPQEVVDEITRYYQEFPVCYGRSAHQLSQKLDSAVHDARKTVASFIGAKSDHVVFTRNATESLNWVTHMVDWSQGDVVLVSDKEHNSNMIPWLKLRDQGVIVDIVQTADDNTFVMDNLQDAFTKHKGKVKLVCFGHVSNIDGVTFPIKEITKIVHKHKALVCVDGCQALLHHDVNVKKLDVDFYAFSGHKMCGPNIGVLYMKDTSWSAPLSGGSTVQWSTHDNYREEKSPAKFEAGIQQYADILGLAKACALLSQEKKREQKVVELNIYLTEQLDAEISAGKIVFLGPQDPQLRGSIFNFWVSGVDSHDIGQLLNANNVAVRTGMHCCHSWYDARKKKTSVRVSLAFYTTKKDVDIFVSALRKVMEIVG